MLNKLMCSVRISLVFVLAVILVSCGRNSVQRAAEKKFQSLIERKMAFSAGSYAKGMIPAGEYAFASRTGGYYSETVNGQILDNTNFDAFGYVFNHGLGNIETHGTLITLDGLRELGFSGARGWYESMVGQKDYNFSGHYKIGVDIPAGTYTVKSVGQAYVEINRGPVGNKSIVENSNFNGSRTVSVLDGQYLRVSKGIIEGLPTERTVLAASEGVASTTERNGSFEESATSRSSGQTSTESDDDLQKDYFIKLSDIASQFYSLEQDLDSAMQRSDLTTYIRMAERNERVFAKIATEIVSMPHVGMVRDEAIKRDLREAGEALSTSARYEVEYMKGLAAMARCSDTTGPEFRAASARAMEAGEKKKTYLKEWMTISTAATDRWEARTKHGRTFSTGATGSVGADAVRSESATARRPLEVEPVRVGGETKEPVKIGRVQPTYAGKSTEPQPEEPLTVSGDVKEPVEISRVQPVFPEAARKARLQGIVTVRGVITREGTVESAQVLSGVAPLLDNAALRAFEQWKYQPATLNGKPVPVYLTATMTFRLQ